VPYLIDGSNVLGVMRADRHSEESKRGLVRLLAGFARAKKTRVTCVFDGPEPPSFAKSLGAVSVVFSTPKTGDEVIIARAAQGRGWSVVTSDRALAAKVKRRQVEIVEPVAFIREVENASTGDAEVTGDWDAYFSDDKNRLKF
jgi:predicted RNA-binding protein with PIN domain